MNDRMERIRAQLELAFKPNECNLVDESSLHAGHAGAASGGGHYRLRLISENFEGLSRVKRHRLVYDCLANMMISDIHALAIEAVAPSEI